MHWIFASTISWHILTSPAGVKYPPRWLSIIEQLETRRLLATVPTITNLSDVADASVQGGIHASTNYGQSKTLQEKYTTPIKDNTRETYVRFDLSSVSSIGSAKLRFYGNLGDTDSTSTKINVYSVSNTSWQENTIVWNGKPAVSNEIQLSSATITGSSPQWYEFDVTDYVKSQKSVGKNLVSFDLKAAPVSGALVNFNSDEAAANRPMMQITSVVTQPATSGVKATAIGDHQISLSWPAAGGATGYEIDRQTAAGLWSVIAADIQSTTYIDSNLAEHTQYNYHIVPLAADGSPGTTLTASATTSSFKMFNNMFPNNPDMTAFGIPPLTLAPTLGYVNGKPDIATARYDARLAAGIKMNPKTNQPLLNSSGQIQFVHSPQNLVIGEENGYDLNTDSGRQDMLTVIAAIRSEWASYPNHPELKNLKLGIFGPIPAGPPTDIQLNDPAVLDKWDAQTDTMASVAQAIDFVSPVLYMTETDQSDFAARMSLMIRNARRLNKPVYAYIWPEYFEQAQDLPTHELIGKDQWQAVLDETRNEADGVVIWGGEHRFDPNLPWAHITENYLSAKLLPSPQSPTNFVVDPIGLHLTWQGVDSTSRVRIERSIDGGLHWRSIGQTEPGAASFDDPEYMTSPSGFAPEYRIQACNPFASSDYVFSGVIHPSRDAFAVTRTIWHDAVHPHPNQEDTFLANLNPGEWVEFQNMAFRQNADHITVDWRSESSMDIWIDCTVNPDNSLNFSNATKVGSILGRRLNQPLGDPPVIFWEQSAPVSVSGGANVTHNVFLVSTSGDINIQSVEFGGANDAPAPPRHLTASGQGGKVLLTWFDESDDETGFEIERSSDLGMTWTRLPDAPPQNPSVPTEANALDSYVITNPGDAMYTWRISALHGAGAARDPITDVASGSSKLRPAGVAFKAVNYDREIAVGDDPQIHDQLFHTELGNPSTHDSEAVQKYSWVKYSAVDFGNNSNRITMNLSTELMIKPGQTISFYIDALSPDHKLVSWTPQWTGSGGNYEDETFAIPATSGIHDLYMQLDAPIAFSTKTIRIDKISPVPDISAKPAADPKNVHLMWNDTSSEVTGYIVQWRKVMKKTNPTPSDYIAWASHPFTAGTHSLDISGLARNTDYEFCVIARTASGGRPSVRIKYHTPS